MSCKRRAVVRSNRLQLIRVRQQHGDHTLVSSPESLLLCNLPAIIKFVFLSIILTITSDCSLPIIVFIPKSLNRLLSACSGLCRMLFRLGMPLTEPSGLLRCLSLYWQCLYRPPPEHFPFDPFRRNSVSGQTLLSLLCQTPRVTTMPVTVAPNFPGYR